MKPRKPFPALAAALFLGVLLCGPLPAGADLVRNSSDEPPADSAEGGALAIHLEGYGESGELAASLAADGFVLSPDSGHADIFGLYAEFRQNMQPLFLTSDLTFHSAHKLFNHSLRVLELEQLPRLRAFSRSLYYAALEMRSRLGTGEKPTTARAADQLIAYFAVANRLLGTEIEMAPPLAETVAAEMALIEAHKGFAFSRVLAQKEDFSQYAVRGHYTRNEELGRYFKAAMWYGRRMFRMDETRPGGAGDPPDTPNVKGWWSEETEEPLPEIARTEILSAALLVHLLDRAKVGGTPAMAAYRELKAPFDYLVGPADDVTPEILAGALGEALGDQWTIADLSQNPKVFDVARELAADYRPEIDATGLGRTGLTLLGQRRILDAAFFQKLVHGENHPMPYTGEAEEKPFTWVRDPVAGEVRGFPRGLDLMAILGSGSAESLLRSLGDADYKGYGETLAGFQAEMKDFAPAENVYERMLFAFMPLFRTPENAPAFMKSPAWGNKSLNTALGAWAELRHDAILYGKQSYTSVPRGMMEASLRRAYLEPVPEVYRRLNAAAEMIRKAQVLALPEYLSGHWTTLAEATARMAGIAEGELSGAEAAAEDADFLLALPERLHAITRLPAEVAERVLNPADEGMALAADVHTRMPHALTEAIGPPGKIIVLLPGKNGPELFFGGVYTYREFKVPYEDRLTDEAWRERLDAGKAPAPLLF